MAGRKSFPGSVVPLTAGIHPLASKERSTAVGHLHFCFSLPKSLSRELEGRVANGEVVAPAELARRYVPDRRNVEGLASWLATKGFEITHLTADHTSLYAAAKTAHIERALDVRMVQFTKGDRRCLAAEGAPSLPAHVAGDVHHIGGLQPFLRLRRRGADGRHRVEIVDRASGPPPLLVADLLKAYGAAGLPFTGKGQEIAVLTDALPRPADLKEFWAVNGMPAHPRRIVRLDVKGGTLPALHGEESIDVQWASGIASGAAIRVYASGSLDLVDLSRALDAIIADAARRPGLRQMSMSFGIGELELRRQPGQLASFRQKFLRLAAMGVNVFVASGDDGSSPEDPEPPSRRRLQTEYPASDPHVVAVGGTTLALGTDGTVERESAWHGSGGGASRYFSRPAWQRDVPGLSQPKRLVPDVSLAADPHRGGLAVFRGRRGMIGGTSWATPVWAGFCAILNEARSKSGRSPLPYLNPMIYPLAGTPCFRDVTVGSNGAYHARPGFDLITGIGVPRLDALISKLS